MIPLQQYDFSVVYKAGIENPADYLSRHPVKNASKEQSDMVEDYIKFLTNAVVPDTSTLDEINEAAQQDRTLRALRAALKTGYWNIDDLKQYQKIKEEIPIDHANHVLLRGQRIILPSSLQDRAIKLAHLGHQGHSKTTALLREYVWLPQLAKLVKSAIEGCLACQSLAQPNPPEPLLSTPLSDHTGNMSKLISEVRFLLDTIS